MTRLRALTIACPLLAALAVGLWPPPAGDAQGVGQLRERAADQRARERSLSGGAARLGDLIARVERQLAVLDRRRAEVQVELDADQARLARIQADLRAERARLARLRARLAEARAALRDRLVALYKAPEPDLATIALSVNDLSDLVERTTFLRRVRDQDQRIVGVVRSARADARREVAAYARDAARAADVVAGMRARRDALASMSQAAAGRRSALSQARAARLAALQATRASRQGVERRIRSLEAAEARAARARAAARTSPAVAPDPGGAWAIPWAIVQCESGGQNLPPNGAGASGYYQIIPGTWRLYGGRGPAAWKAPKAEQDRVAASIWRGGAGASQWVCAALV